VQADGIEGCSFAGLAGPACLAITLWIALNVGPSLTAWKLTGQHRIGFLRTEPMTRA
jgi:hypothetical protein